MRNIYQKICENLQAGIPGILITKYSAEGICKTLVGPDELPESDRLDEDIPAFCQQGRELSVTEYYYPRQRLIILGGGHIALPLSDFGSKLGFDVLVFDDRPSFANAARFPHANEVICDGFDRLTQRITFRDSDFVTIVTRGHRHDSLCLEKILAGEQPFYVGMIGSKRRIAIVRKQLEESTGAIDKLSGLHAPIGLPIGAVTPEEIAISILAEIIQCRRSDTTGKLQHAPTDLELLKWLAELQEDVALISVVETEGSVPREAGAKMALTLSGRTAGSIGGGCAEADIITQARDVIKTGLYRLAEVDLTDSAEEDGMVCGGKMKVLIEPLNP